MTALVLRLGERDCFLEDAQQCVAQKANVDVSTVRVIENIADAAMKPFVNCYFCYMDAFYVAIAVPKKLNVPQETLILQALGYWDGIFHYIPPNFKHEKSRPYVDG